MLHLCYQDVKDFHEAFGHPVSDRPKFLDGDRKYNRIQWMLEEIEEFVLSETIEDQADAMIDLIYFAVGTMVEMGVDPYDIWNVVQDANMSKLFPDGKPHYNEDGKVIKPEGWSDPQPLILQIIERMG